MDDTLLPEIERFLALTKMTPTAFSQAAIKDRHFVRQLRKGRRVWPETAQKARDFMDAHLRALEEREAA